MVAGIDPEIRPSGIGWECASLPLYRVKKTKFASVSKSVRSIDGWRSRPRQTISQVHCALLL